MDLIIKNGQVDEKRLSVFAMSIAICKFNGGGMMIAPHAIYNDGLLSLTLVEKISRLKVLKNFFRLFDGSFVKNKEVKTFDTRKLSVAAKCSFGVEMGRRVVRRDKINYI